MNFSAVILIFFFLRNDATGTDLPASDLDGIVNELLETELSHFFAAPPP